MNISNRPCKAPIYEWQEIPKGLLDKKWTYNDAFMDIKVETARLEF